VIVKTFRGVDVPLRQERPWLIVRGGEARYVRTARTGR